MRRLARVTILVVAVALAGCATNAETAAKRCAGQPNSAYDQCIAREQARLAAAQQPPASNQGGY